MKAKPRLRRFFRPSLFFAICCIIFSNGNAAIYTDERFGSWQFITLFWLTSLLNNHLGVFIIAAFCIYYTWMMQTIHHQPLLYYTLLLQINITVTTSFRHGLDLVHNVFALNWFTFFCYYVNIYFLKDTMWLYVISRIFISSDLYNNSHNIRSGCNKRNKAKDLI